MAEYLVLEVATVAYAYNVEANSEKEAIEKLEKSLCTANDEDIIRLPEDDETIDRRIQCEGEIQ